MGQRSAQPPGRLPRAALGPDLTSGFRAARREHLLEFLHLLPNGFSSPTTTTLAFLRAGYNVRFEPIDARQRNGQSKIKLARDGAKFFLILLKVITIYSPLRIFVPLSLAAFTLGVVYGAWTAVQQSRIPNGAVLLLMFAVIVFLVGLVSEQISTLHFAPRQRLMNALILVPTYNERENLPILVGEVLSIDGTRVLVLDDGSPDGTGQIADELARQYPGASTSCIDRSTRAGTLLSRRVSHRDRERRRRRVPDGRRPVTRSEVPAVADRGHGGRGSGHRLALHPGGGVENWPFHRVMLSGFANTYIRTVTGLRIHDCTAGFRCWRRDALARMPLDRDHLRRLFVPRRSRLSRGRGRLRITNGRSCSSNAGWARRSCRAAC